MPANQASVAQQSPTIDVVSAAKFLRLSERTIRRLVADRAISHRRVVGLIRFTQDDLDEFVARSRVPTEA